MKRRGGPRPRLSWGRFSLVSISPSAVISFTCSRDSSTAALENSGAVRAAQALGEGVCVGLARIDEAQCDPALLRALEEWMRGQIAAVVEAQCHRLAVHLDELLEHRNRSQAWDGSPHRNA